MKLICTQENFKKAILNTERVVSKQTTLPILNNILFKAEKSGLKLSATNLEIGVVVKLGAKIEEEGEITIPARLLGNFINNLPAGENISLEVKEQNLKIKSGSARAVIKGLPAGDFPLIPQKTSDFQIKIKSSVLKNIISKVISCVAFNETRQELTGVNLTLKEKELFFDGLSYITGFSHGFVAVNKKSSSETSYTMRRKITLAVNAVTSFSDMPLYFISFMGIILVLIAVSAILYLVFMRISHNDITDGWTSLLIVIIALGGLNLSALGIIGLYIAKIFIETKNRPFTIIRSVYNQKHTL